VAASANVCRCLALGGKLEVHSTADELLRRTIRIVGPFSAIGS